MNTAVARDLLCLNPTDNRRLAALCGPANEHIQQIENHFGVKIHQRSNRFHITGAPKAIEAAGNILKRLYQATNEKAVLTARQVMLYLNESISKGTDTMSKETQTTTDDVIHTKRIPIKPHGQRQQEYINHIRHNAINFAIGPAGTGKTYLAVACALEALQKQLINRLILVRPAVEAGEKLGFLPGEIADKVAPYLRPIYDALYDMMGVIHITKLVEENIIEIAPLAFMRGRTLNDAFIILDEAQNTTIEQMRMFLTRIGFGSTAVITGDITQVDLAHNTKSGLTHAATLLKNIEGISFTYFEAKDAVRHPLIQSIIRAYEDDDQEKDK